NGDISISLKPAALIPEITCTIGLNNQTAVSDLLEKLLGANIQTMAIEGAEKGWMAAVQGLPFMMHIGIGKDKLIVSTNMKHITNIMNGQNLLDASAAQGSTAYVYMDLPLIAQTYLPMVWGMTMNLKEPLCQTTLEMARWDIRNIYQSLAQADNIDQAAWDAALKRLWRRDKMISVFGNQDLVTSCLSSFSAWKKTADEEGNNPQQNTIVLLRTADGYHNFGNWNRKTLQLKDAQNLVRGFEKICGPDIAALPEIEVEQPPMLDAHWIPPMQKVIDHLPLYEASLESSAPGTASIDEKGLPLATLMLSSIGSILWFDTAERKARVIRNKAQAAKRKEQIEREAQKAAGQKPVNAGAGGDELEDIDF
ncbi:MAG: hypothetical protein HRU15_05125, partial [Planctomycetes bacterium]|nr:hypothetical protein [Planctomycetota bacterium]